MTDWRGPATSTPPSARGVKLPNVDPFADPPPQNPLQRPDHWSHKRRPANEAEARELAAWTFHADSRLELALLVRERYPHLAGQINANIAAVLDDYAARRAVALDAGRRLDVRLPSMAELDAAAATIAEHDDAEPRRVYEEGRQDFAAKVEANDLSGALATWRDWTDACSAAVARAQAAFGARGVLGLSGGSTGALSGPDGPKPRGFLAELDQLTGGYIASVTRIEG